MINWPNQLKILGLFILALSGAMSVALALAIYDNDDGLFPLALSTALSVGVGGLLVYFIRPEEREFNNREGIMLVILTWVGAGIVGALPFYFSPHFGGFTDAFFESVSGFTTTGATILTSIETLPRSLLFWRAFTQWVGGMGIIVLAVAILPLVGVGGMELYRAEFSGASSEKIKPRIAETAKSLWRIYAAYSIAQYVALRVAGMTPFDSICHTFTTMATGGFSTRNISVEAYNSPAIEYVIIFFMFAAGINITMQYRLLIMRRPKIFLRDLEIQTYFAATGAAIVAVMITLWINGLAKGEEAFRQAAFQVVSIMTTTGFSSADFEVWPPFALLLLLALMFLGGCTGSTAGGLKVGRVALLGRVVGREFRRIVERRGVFAVRFNDKAVSENAIDGLLNLIYLAFIINFAACLFLTAFGVDVVTAISAVAASMFNIGPGLGDVGPTDHYAHFHAPVKWVLAFCMLAGRLEFYTLLVICTRAYWRK
ncbi:MAG TPA: potassium transporter TrkG [Acidobacteriota bacterium]|nr:potassium transporter TrkG [Acidobacteriota bacterium]